MLSVLIYAAAFLLAAFCSGTETAFSAAGRIRIAAEGKKGRRAIWFLDRPSRYLVTTLVGTNVGVVLASSIGHEWGADLGGVWYFIFAMATAVFLLVLAEIVPKQLALFRSNSFAIHSAFILYVLRIVLFPLIATASGFSRLISGPSTEGRFFESKEEVRGLLVSYGGKQGRLASSVIKMGHEHAGDYSKPLTDFPSVESSCTREEAVEILIDSGEDFLLIWEKLGATLIGSVRGSVLVRWNGSGSITKLATGLPYFHAKFPPLKILPRLWSSGASAAVIMDGNGQPGRLITPAMILAHLIPEASRE